MSTLHQYMCIHTRSFGHFNYASVVKAVKVQTRPQLLLKSSLKYFVCLGIMCTQVLLLMNIFVIQNDLLMSDLCEHISVYVHKLFSMNNQYSCCVTGHLSHMLLFLLPDRTPKRLSRQQHKYIFEQGLTRLSLSAHTFCKQKFVPILCKIPLTARAVAASYEQISSTMKNKREDFSEMPGQILSCFKKEE